MMCNTCQEWEPLGPGQEDQGYSYLKGQKGAEPGIVLRQERYGEGSGCDGRKKRTEHGEEAEERRKPWKT